MIIFTSRESYLEHGNKLIKPENQYCQEEIAMLLLQTPMSP
jgi:hypothetical protein